MGFALTLLYIALMFLTPAEVMPFLAPYRVQVWVAVLAIVCSLPTMLSDSKWRTPQLLFFAALMLCIPLSLIAGPRHWVSGGIDAIMSFLPNGIVLLLVIVNCRSVKKLKILTTMLLVIAAYFVFRGARAYFATDLVENDYVLLQPMAGWESDASRVLPRIRALSLIHDPNDFAQFILCLLPYLWLAWRAGKRSLLLVLCGVPTAYFAWGLYLTHSRGAIVASAVLLLFACRRKLGVAGTGLVTVLAVAGLFAMNFSGGRSVSLEGGADRLELWGDGLALFRSSPLFGIGFNEFADAAGLTAHNSFVVCLAELGLLGYFFWIAPIVLTFHQLNGVVRGAATNSIRPGEAEEPEVAEPEEAGPPEDAMPLDVRRNEIQRFAVRARLSLIAFLTTGWFLSRSFPGTFWLVLGMAVAIVQIADSEGLPINRPALPWILKWTSAMAFLSISIVYAMLRARGL